MAFKLYRFIRENDKKFIGFFPNDNDLITFLNNKWESNHYGIKAKDEFKTLMDIKVFIANGDGLLYLEEVLK